METTRRQVERQVRRDALDELMGAVVGGELQAPRVASLRAGVDGVLQAAGLGVHAMGHGLAVAHGLAPRQAITQGDRRLSTPKRLREDVARGWVRFGVAERQALCVNVDWTACEDSEQSMIGLGTQPEHGRRTPLVWKPGTRAALKDQRHAPADALLGRLADGRPAGVRGTVVAERDFSDSTRSQFLKALGFEDIIRCRGVVDVASAAGERRQATDWFGAGGQMRGRRGARVTAEGQPVPMVVCVPSKRMQEPWRLASRRSDGPGAAIKPRSSTRVTVEETCRDVKPPRLGLGLKPTVMARHDRRDALCRLAVLAHTRLTRLGKAGEALGMDRWLGATRPRHDSRVRQGLMRFDLIPTMEQQRLRRLLQRCGQWLCEHTLLSQVLGYL